MSVIENNDLDDFLESCNFADLEIVARRFKGKNCYFIKISTSIILYRRECHIRYAD